jgi:endonuclease/exonuclease/phosphatase family metal-dependent hydrolase
MNVPILLAIVMLLVCSFGCVADAPADPIRVMAFNIRCSTALGDGQNHWSQRKEIFFRTVERFDPDVIGLQEVVADQADELRERFGKSHTFVGVGRDDGVRKGEFAPIMFRNDRFELIDHGHVWLSESPEEPGSVSWDSSMTRMATWVKLRDSQREFIVMNTHYDHIGKAARLQSSKLLRQRFEQLSKPDKLPIVFTGDLNCTEDDEPVRELIAAGLIDAYRACHVARDANEQTFHAYKGETKGSRIDFILHSNDFRAISCEIERTNDDGRYPSDHFAITAILQRAKP